MAKFCQIQNLPSLILEYTSSVNGTHFIPTYLKAKNDKKTLMMNKDIHHNTHEMESPSPPVPSGSATIPTLASILLEPFRESVSER